MGEGMVNNLVKGGRKVVVWNRSRDKCDAFAAAHGDVVTVVDSPRAVVEAVDVTFSMLSTPEASAAVFGGDSGVLAGVSKGKQIVDCATLTVAGEARGSGGACGHALRWRVSSPGARRAA
jgi:3-hydroxyisobutyrate dehydrogenase-like beta-hydroxyacid dehydrogenase